MIFPYFIGKSFTVLNLIQYSLLLENIHASNSLAIISITFLYTAMTNSNERINFIQELS